MKLSETVLPEGNSNLKCFRLECGFDSVWSEQPLIVELKIRGRLFTVFSLGENERNNARAIGILALVYPHDHQWMKLFRRWHTYNLSPERDGFREVVYPEGKVLPLTPEKSKFDLPQSRLRDMARSS